MASSAAYYLACATGSIFVRSLGDCAGVHIMTETKDEMMVLATSGDRKLGNTAEAFQPAILQDEQNMADGLANNFRSFVKKRRGSRLLNEKEALSGATFHGDGAIELGLADGRVGIQSEGVTFLLMSSCF